MLARYKVIVAVYVLVFSAGPVANSLHAMGPHVAIVAAATNSPTTSEQFTDLRDVLVADGRFSTVDIISTTRFGTGTPLLSDLIQYDAIIHWSNNSNDDAVALGNVFADYVDTGRGLVQAVFANTSSNPDRFHKFTSADTVLQVPEPSIVFGLLPLLLTAARCRRKTWCKRV